MKRHSTNHNSMKHHTSMDHHSIKSLVQTAQREYTSIRTTIGVQQASSYDMMHRKRQTLRPYFACREHSCMKHETYLEVVGLRTTDPGHLLPSRPRPHRRVH